MTESSEAVFGATQTLKSLLEFLARLQEQTEVKKKVIKEIKEKVKAYTSNELDTFADEDDNSGYLPQTIDKSNELRKNILKSDKHNEYKHYKSAFQDADADKYTKHLINNVFSLFRCLYYMYYECATECNGIKGGEWWQEKCDGSEGGHGKDLNNWLQDMTGKTGRMIKRGFKEGVLGTKKGTELFPKDQEEDSNRLLSYTNGAQLQLALFFMLFLPKDDKWDHAQSGHAVLFLEAFCEKVTGGQFNGQYTEANEGTFKNVCQKVQDSINKLTGLKIILPVACYPEVQYKNLLEVTHFWNYVKWLQENLEWLIESLQAMASDASKWKKNDLKESKTFGPYPWGFTLSINWESNTGQLNTPLQNLNTALSSFNDALKSISKREGKSEKPAEKSSNSTDSNDSSNSAASTLGGVAGGIGAAAATAGAAYAGSGFLGSVAEGIGKFFKGLLL